MILPKLIRVLSCVCVLCFWGCGGESDSSDSSTDSETTETTSAPVSSPASGNASGGEMASSSASPEMRMGGMMDLGAESGESGGSVASMEDERMAAMNLEGFGPDGGGGTGAPRKPQRPAKISDWTPTHIAEAITDSDAKVIIAIEAFANKTRGQAAGVEQLSTWIAALSNKPTGNGNNGVEMRFDSGSSGADAEMMEEMGGGFGAQRGGQGAGAKEKIAQALLAALATNGTRNAYTVVGNVLSGSVDLGVDKAASMEWAMSTLIKNVGDPNNPGRGLLWTALTTQNKLSPPPKEAKEEGTATGKPVASLQQRTKELHMGFAIATMNGLIGASGPKGKPSGNAFGGTEGRMGGGDFGDMRMDMAMEGSAQGGGNLGGDGGAKPATTANPVVAAPVSLSKEEAESALSYFWSKQMIDLAAAQLNQNMNSPEALVFASAFPVAETRGAVRTALNEHRHQSPSSWIHKSVFSEQLADPAIHVYIKSLPREKRVGASNRGGAGGSEADREGPGAGSGSAPPPRRRPRVGSKKKKEKEVDPLAEVKKEARYGWMDASEQTMLSLMQRMYQGSMKADAAPYQTADLPFQLHRGSEVTKSMRFALPADANASQTAEQTIVSYVRIESKQMTQKTVQHYRTSVRDEKVVTILGGNGMWLDGAVKPNKKAGTIRSIDVLLSRGNSRPPLKRNQKSQAEFGAGGEFAGGNGGRGNAGGGKSFVVEVLIVEIPDTATKADAAEVSSTTK